MDAFPLIRPVHSNDAESLWHINRAAFGYEYGLEETTARLAAILQKPNDRLWVAESEGLVCGYIHGSDYDCVYMPPLKNILALGMLEAYRGRGIGRLLIGALEDWAGADGCAGVRLVSGFNRTGAHAFYLRCGYTDRKDQKNFIKMF